MQEKSIYEPRSELNDYENNNIGGENTPNTGKTPLQSESYTYESKGEINMKKLKKKCVCKKKVVKKVTKKKKKR